MAWSVRGLENPSSDEFLNNPDFRQIATFFLGWVFFHSGQIILASPLLRKNFMRAILPFLSLTAKSTDRRYESNDIEARSHIEPVATLRQGKAPKYNTAFNGSSAASRPRMQEGDALLVTLALCLACASVAHFASLLQFTAAGETACAFVVAWGGTAAQAARLTGLLILSLELKKLGVRRRETYVFWAWLLALLGLVFANNAIAIGTLRPVQILHISLCYRRHFTPTGLAASLALILTELYFISRFIFLISSKGLGWFSQLDILGDSRVYRSLSLLLLDVLTITSAAKPINLLVDFVPFAIGAVVVLFAFSSESPEERKEATPSLWSYYNETRRFALYPTPAPSMAATLSIRRMSNQTGVHTISLTSPDPSDEPPPAPTRSALSLRVALRDFTTQEQQNSRAVINGHTRIKEELLLTLPDPTTGQSPTSAGSSVQRYFSVHSGNTGTWDTRQSFQKGKRPQMALATNLDEQVSDAPQSLENIAFPGSGVYVTDFLQVPPPRNRSSRTKRSSTSSGLTYVTPISQKLMPSQRPSYLLSPSRSYQQSMISTPHTPVPTWEDMYRQQRLQFDPRLEIPPVPSISDYFNHQSTSSCTPAAPSFPLTAGSPMSPPPGLTRFQPISRPSLLANTPPMERKRGIRGPRPLITASRPRHR